MTWHGHHKQPLNSLKETMTVKEDKALLKAAEKGRLEAVKQALDAGADVNCSDTKGRTAVALAVQANSVACTHEILTRGADPNIPDKNKEFPIHIAACFQVTDVLRILVDSGSVNLESQNKDGNTALHKAAYAGCVDCVMYLTSKGADSKAQNNKYEIPAALARKKNHKGVLTVMKAAQLREKSGTRPVSQIVHADDGMPLEPVRFARSPSELEAEGEASEEKPAEEASSGGPPPPPPGGGPPPPPAGGGPPPPPGGAPNLAAGGGGGGGGGLAGIGQVKLKKSEGPKEDKPAASSGGGGGAAAGGVGGMMAEMMAKRNKMKKSAAEGPSFTTPQLKQFEEDFLFLLKDDINSWKKDICTQLAA